ncbi:embryo sac development arrest 7 [Wolffia australiana]
MATQCGGLKVLSHNGVKVYCITGHRYGATPIPTNKLKSLKKDEEFRRRLDVIHDLKFETATSRIKVTPDGEYVVASGIHPPQMKVYELKDMAQKFERHLTSEIINFQVLSEDYSKMAFLCADRSVCLHAKYGSHYNLRIPRMGRDITYDCWSCDLLCSASSPEVYRINLEQGRFLSSLNTEAPAINKVTRSSVHGLLACGGEDGSVECFDLRAKSSVGKIDACPSEEVTALRFNDDSGFYLAVGSSTGKVLTYDLRSSYPIRVKDHKNDSPIVNINWHQTLNSVKPKLITADCHIVNIWDPDTGDNLTAIQPSGGGSGKINDFCTFPQSGLMLFALDHSQIPSYFVPALGPAPKWIKDLDRIVDEEENAETMIFEDVKFVTEEELEKLNLASLKSSNMVTPYLHGYIVKLHLYRKARALANPFEYEEYVEKKKEDKLEAERAARITIKRKLPKVNRSYAASILQNSEADEGDINKDDDDAAKKSSNRKKIVRNELLKDDRFAALFEDKDFEVDEKSEEYMSRHAHALRGDKKKAVPSLIEEHFDPVLEDDESEGQDDGRGDRSDSDSSAPETPNGDLCNRAKNPRLYEVKDERHAEAFLNRVSLAEEDSLPLGERALRGGRRQTEFGGRGTEVKHGPGGSREITFFSKKRGGSRAEGRGDHGMEREGKRRSVHSLRLKQLPARGRGRRR